MHIPLIRKSMFFCFVLFFLNVAFGGYRVEGRLETSLKAYGEEKEFSFSGTGI